MCHIITFLSIGVFTCTYYLSNAQNFRLKTLKRELCKIDTSILYTSDSVTYYYTGTKKGIFPNNTITSIHPFSYHYTELFKVMCPDMKYDSATYVSFLPTDSIRNIYKLKQTFDVNDNILFFLGTTYIRPFLTPFATTVDTYTYVSNKIIEHRYGGLERYIYNSLGQLDTFIGYEKSVYFYNSSGQLTQIIEYHTYGNVEINYMYNLSGQLVSISKYKNLSGTWAMFNRFLYTYTSAGNIGTEIQEIQESVSGSKPLANYDKREFSYDASNNMTSYIYYNWDAINASWDTAYKYDYSYNNADLIATAESRKWIDGSWQYYSDTVNTSSKITFIYEPNWPADITNNIAALAIKLYPSPTSNFVRIEVSKEFKHTFKAAIYDMEGRLIRSWNEPACKSYNRTIPIAELADGVYSLKLADSNGEHTRTFVVAH